MAGFHRDVIRSRFLQSARREFVPRQRLHFMRLRYGIRTRQVLHRLAILDSKERDIYRNLIALHQLDLQKNQLWRSAIEIELVPIRPHGIIRQRNPRSAGHGHIFCVVAIREHGLAKPDLRRVFPTVARGAFHFVRQRPLVHLQMISPCRAGHLDRNRRVARPWNAELTVEIGVTGMERFLQ